jgi:hypothetical protein
VWVEHQPASSWVTSLWFVVYGTGQGIEADGDHVGTVFTSGGVWHVYSVRAGAGFWSMVAVSDQEET